MAGRSIGPIRKGLVVNCYVMIGFVLNSLLHLHRFRKIGLTHITCIIVQNQLIKWAFVMCGWMIPPLILSKYIHSAMKHWWLSTLLIPLAFLFINQLSGRGILKLIFDILLVGILLGWLLIDNTYGHYLSTPPSEKSFSYVVSELMIIFQISLALLTFVINIFGFSFAPGYIEKYYNQDLAQPTVWWFSLLTIYLTIGNPAFICFNAWSIAIKLRSGLD